MKPGWMARQKSGRIGVLRRAKHIRDITTFDNLPSVHYQDSISHLGHDAEVVGNENHRELRIRTKFNHQLKDLRLRGDIEGRRRFIRNKQSR